MEDTAERNTRMCKQIADELEAYTFGDNYKCPECDEIIYWEEDNYNEDTDEYTCPHCHCVVSKDEMKQVSMWDYLSETDIYNIEYRINGQREYRSVELMVACGGPNIYIDTDRKAVELFWCIDKAEYPLSSKVCDEIDCYFEEMYSIE